jgi:hypothetical protein
MTRKANKKGQDEPAMSRVRTWISEEAEPKTRMIRVRTWTSEEAEPKTLKVVAHILSQGDDPATVPIRVRISEEAGGLGVIVGKFTLSP